MQWVLTNVHSPVTQTITMLDPFLLLRKVYLWLFVVNYLPSPSNQWPGFWSVFCLFKISYKYNHKVCKFCTFFLWHSAFLRVTYFFFACIDALFFISKLYSITLTYHKLVIHLAVDEHLSCFYCLLYIKFP